jgi:ABC-2 type transport system permease protein
MKNLTFYSKIWWLLTRNAFSVVLSQKVTLLFFLTGKVLRFLFFITFLFYVILGSNGLAGYTSNQVIFFFLVFGLVDTVSQFLFREVYRFRPKIVTGDFDLTLAKPLNPLFLSLMGGADIIDFITIPPLLFAVIYSGSLFDPSFFQILIFLTLFINAIFVSAAFHIAVLAMGIITLEIDHTIMIYRDLSSFGRFPIDIYKEPLKTTLTYLIPIGIMITIPAKALMGMASFQVVSVSLIFGIFTFIAANKFWHYALTKYTSASS